MRLRYYERTRLIYYLRVFDAEKGECLGYLADINTRGLMIIGEKCLPADSRYMLRMDLPKNLADDKHVSFRARIMWCRKEAGTEYHAAGFSIESMDEDVLETIRSLMRDFYQEEIRGGFEEETNPRV